MNSRKFYFVVIVIISLFLFVVGAVTLGFLNKGDGSGNGFLNSIISPFKSLREPVNVLVLGGDKVNKNTDTMMLVNFNPASAKLNILSIPRDTKVKIKGIGTSKINAAYPSGGANLAMDTVSSLLNVKVKYYMFVDTSAFRKIIDILGGVEFDVPANMDYDDPVQNLHIHLKKGPQHLDGAKAEQFMRFRHPTNYTKEISQYYDGSDLKRIDAQQKFIKELIRQKVNVANITKLNSVISTVFKNVETNLKLDNALKLSQNIGKLKSNEMQMMKLPGNDSNEPGGWYYIADKQQANEIVKKYFSDGGSLVNSTNNNDDVKNNDSNKPANTGNNKKKPAVTETKKSVTKDNPSNADTSVKGTTKADP